MITPGLDTTQFAGDMVDELQGNIITAGFSNGLSSGNSWVKKWDDCRDSYPLLILGHFWGA